MSWKPVIQTINDPKFYPNGLAFETKEEALASAKDTFSRWMLARAFDAIESDQAVNYKWVDGIGLDPVPDGDVKPKQAT